VTGGAPCPVLEDDPQGLTFLAGWGTRSPPWKPHLQKSLKMALEVRI